MPVDLPVADKTTCCGLPPPLSLTETAPVNVPKLFELKCTVMVQDPLAGTLDPQLLVWEKVVEPVILMLLMVSVVVCGGGGHVLGLIWQWKNRLEGLSFTTVPTPLRATVCGLLDA